MSDPASKQMLEWFDQLEDILALEAKSAGFFQHGTMIGSAREFFVRRVLGSVLPPIVHIGSGRIFDHTGKRSHQVDVIVFDSRAPVFTLAPGLSLYPIEGVLATIEVKSTLYADELVEALDNTLSVLKLQVQGWDAPLPIRPGDESRSADPVEHRIQSLVRQGTPLARARRKVGYQLKPATYVFGFDGYKGEKNLRDAVENWYADKQRPKVFGGACDGLPTMIATPSTLGLLNDERFRINSTEAPDAEIAMVFTKSERRFGIMVSHLLDIITGRIGILNTVVPMCLTIHDYLPIKEYTERLSRGELYGAFLYG